MEKSNKEIENSEIIEDLNKIENIAFIDLNGAKISIEILESQKYENVEAIPIRSDFFGKKDFLTLKKGYEMNLVEIKELDHSTVNAVSCKNDSVAPLILIDGDEITGAMQNRIINDTLLIPAKSTVNIPVSCTEHGRWHTRGEGEASRTFEPSLYSANHSTRSRKSRASYEERDYQGEVWDSISEFESRSNFKSMTSALNDSYENLKDKQNDYLSKFHIEDGQNGVIFIVNGEIKGLELFYNHSIYKQYHEKLCRSYIIEAIVEKKSVDNIDRLEFVKVMENISHSEFKSKKSIGLGDNVKFSNDFGSGSSLVWEDELIHMTFFKDFVINEVII
ncbi:ARPP-1 family domain-containing protein [Methanobrevibacter ruminantium]|uniref:ARPP-1 family domain-containing protein n=1 Tax=Methanobrevibacter ruminantium TaxID=83816 RepID=UPI003F09EA38